MKKIFLAAGLLLLLTACSAPKETVTPAPTPVAVATPTPTPTPTPAPTPEEIPSYTDPITGFFWSLTLPDGSTTPAINWRSRVKTEAWRTEVRYIYDVLRRDASPRIKELIDLDKLEQEFLDFAQAQGEVEGFCWTTAYGDEVGGYDEQILYGSGFAAAGQWSEAALLSAHAKAWYGDFTWLRDDRPILDEYVFDPSAVLEQLDADEIPFTVGEYTLDADVEEEPAEEPENPIDDWLEENLDDSGITYIMAENAWLEMEIWEKELRHAYDLMIAKAHPTDPAPREALERARDALLAYAPVYGECEALYLYSMGFHPESWEEDPDVLLAGSMTAMVVPAVTGQCYRAVTFRLWDMLNWTGPYAEEPDYAFDPADYENRFLSPPTETATP